MSAWAEFGAADQQQTSDWSKVAIKSWISSLKLVRLGRDSSTDSGVIIKRIKLVAMVVYTARGARENIRSRGVLIYDLLTLAFLLWLELGNDQNVTNHQYCLAYEQNA